MDLTLDCLGITTAINIHRCQAGSHLVRIPNAAQVLGALTSSIWKSSGEQAEQLAIRFDEPEFWKGEAGYAFIHSELPILLEGQRKRVLDVGCSVGQLVTFLKDARIWPDLNYLGVDADEGAVRIAGQRHADAKFDSCDAQQSLNDRVGEFDVVLTKGTICSTYQPYEALKAILECATESALLVHTACTTSDCGEEGFVTTLYASESNAYVFTIMNLDSMMDFIESAGFCVTKQSIRRRPKNVLNLGTYRLYDLVLKRAKETQRSTTSTSRGAAGGGSLWRK